MKKNLFIFFVFFVGNVLLFIIVEHYFNYMGIQMSWAEISENWPTFIIAGLVAAIISTLIWINHKK